MHVKIKDANKIIEEDIHNYYESINSEVDSRTLYKIEIVPESDENPDRYIITVINKETMKEVEKFIYQKQKDDDSQENSDKTNSLSSTDETESIDSLYNVLYSDPDGRYNILEFSENMLLEKSEKFNSDLVDQIIQMCVSYSLIAGIYKFTVKCDYILMTYNIILNKLLGEGENNYQENQHSHGNNNNSTIMTPFNFYDSILNMHFSAKEKFDKFMELKGKDLDKTKYGSLINDLNKCNMFLVNFTSLLNGMFQDGYLVANHNRKINKRKENENGINNYSLNLIGFDYISYLLQGLFQTKPKYSFSGNLLDFDSLFNSYIDFVNKLIDCGTNLVSEIELDEIIDTIQTKKYFLQLIYLYNASEVLNEINIFKEEQSWIDKDCEGWNRIKDRINLCEMTLDKMNQLEYDEDIDLS